MNDEMQKLISTFRKLPAVGTKTAQRYAYQIINMSEKEVEDFVNVILNAKKKIKYCSSCGGYSTENICGICQHRPGKIICVVSEPKEVDFIEKTKSFDGVYHVLHGTISPLENRGPEDIKIRELLERVQKMGTEEVILALNPTIEGDVTGQYISKLLKPLGIKVTKIAQGISIGTELEYADETTLGRAILSRFEF